MFTEKEKKLLLSLICFEQISILRENRGKINSDIYKELNDLRAKIESINTTKT